MSDDFDLPHLPSAANDAAADSDPLLDLLDACAATLVADPTPQAFLDWIAAQGPRLAPGLDVDEPATFQRVLRERYLLDEFDWIIEGRGVSTFVFSTRLFEVTPMLRARSFEEALRMVEERVDGWSGGTQIGHSLSDFNRRFARDRVHRNTIVIIVSDGWDRGESAVLGREMAALGRRARRVIWLNPLLGQEGYEPLTRGMSAALPFCDDFMPVHNVDSLAAFGRHLMAVSSQ